MTHRQKLLAWLLTVVGRDGERSHPTRYHYKGAADASA